MGSVHLYPCQYLHVLCDQQQFTLTKFDDDYPGSAEVARSLRRDCHRKECVTMVGVDAFLPELSKAKTTSITRSIYVSSSK